MQATSACAAPLAGAFMHPAYRLEALGASLPASEQAVERLGFSRIADRLMEQVFFGCANAGDRQGSNQPTFTDAFGLH